MSVSAAIRRMLAAGLTIEQALIAAESFEAEAVTAAPPLTKRQARNKRYYDKKKASESSLNSDDQDVSDDQDASLSLSSPEGSSPTPPSPKPLQSIPPSPPKGGSSPAGFETFWAEYPHKVGKRDAEKAFAKANSRTDLETLMAGLRRYAAKTDDRPWCNPSTWLNQDRWTDVPASQPIPHRHSQAPPMTPNQQRHQAAIEAFDRRLGVKRDDEFTGNTLDLERADFGHH